MVVICPFRELFNPQKKSKLCFTNKVNGHAIITETEQGRIISQKSYFLDNQKFRKLNKVNS